MRLESSEKLEISRKQLERNEKRIAELKRLFIKIYEDNANGKLSDERFDMLSQSYEAEQKQLESRVVELQAFLAANRHCTHAAQQRNPHEDLAVVAGLRQTRELIRRNVLNRIPLHQRTPVARNKRRFFGGDHFSVGVELNGIAGKLPLELSLIRRRIRFRPASREGRAFRSLQLVSNTTIQTLYTN